MRILAAGLGAVVLVLTPAWVLAQTPSQAPTDSSEAARRAELNAAWQSGQAAASKGPTQISLLDQGGLRLPDRHLFIPKTEGTRILRALGNTVNEQNFVGLVVGTRQTDGWLVVVTYIKAGYIKEDDAKNWNADELLNNLRRANDETNRDRLVRGFPEIEILGWVQAPAYDVSSHRLVWSASTRPKGLPDSADIGINYNTYALGRDGYFSLNLLTSSTRVNSDKSVAHELLAALSYNTGKRYEDFNASTDHIAEYGLAAL